MSYRQLNAQTVIDYLAQQAEMADKFDDFKYLEVNEIGDGNLNYVYRIKDPKTNQSVILKQAVPYLRCVGESYPLTRHRMNFEIMALETAYRYCPEHVPEVYHASTEQSVVVMQDLCRHNILRGEIIRGVEFPRFAEHISSYMADTLFYTSDMAMRSTDKKAMVKQFINPSLCQLTENFVFSHPYVDHQSNVYNPELGREAIDKVQKDPAVKVAVAQMRYKFMNNAQALLHGDLHIGSIMVNQEQTFVIDPEFAFFGPMGFDIGAVIGNLYMSYFSHAGEQYIQGEQTAAYRSWLLETISQIWNGFYEKFIALWYGAEKDNPDSQWPDLQGQAFRQYVDSYMAELFADTLGFAACKMMRRVIGLAKVADFADIPDLKVRARIETDIIAHASEMIVNRNRYTSINELNALAQRIGQ